MILLSILQDKTIMGYNRIMNILYYGIKQLPIYISYENISYKNHISIKNRKVRKM